MDGAFFPETGRDHNTNYASADTGLWFIWALSQCAGDKISKSHIWESYGETIKTILEGYHKGNEFIKVMENNLLYINHNFPAITWMNAIVEGKAVTPRYGYVVEVNALWYNAIMFALDLAAGANEGTFVKRWKRIASNIPQAFLAIFWNDMIGCLADYVADGKQNISIRPNQVIATSTPYSPLSEAVVIKVLDTIKSQLLTPKGLRTLSPQDPSYKPKYCGDTYQRDKALHQGTVWPWLTGHFAEAYLKIYKHNGVEFIDTLYHNFEEDMMEDGIGTIGEFFEGDPPHHSKGAISFAVSVAELLRIQKMVKLFSDTK